MTSLAVVDAGPLYAAADADDEDHLACRTALSRADLRLIVPALAVAEATYFVGRRLPPRRNRRFSHRLGRATRCPNNPDPRPPPLHSRHTTPPQGVSTAAINTAG